MFKTKMSKLGHFVLFEMFRKVRLMKKIGIGFESQILQLSFENAVK